jgi:hypothetical protein
LASFQYPFICSSFCMLWDQYCWHPFVTHVLPSVSFIVRDIYSKHIPVMKSCVWECHWLSVFWWNMRILPLMCVSTKNFGVSKLTSGALIQRLFCEVSV